MNAYTLQHTVLTGRRATRKAESTNSDEIDFVPSITTLRAVELDLLVEAICSILSVDFFELEALLSGCTTDSILGCLQKSSVLD